MEFQELINRVGRRLKIPYSRWNIRGKNYIFRDVPGSITPIIVYNEIRRWFYKIRLEPGDVVLDIGAHIGMFTIPLAKENPSVKFICYEPNFDNFNNLCHNVIKARLTNVICYNAGLAKQDGGLLYSSSIEWNSGGSPTMEFGQRSQEAKKMSSVMVRGFTLEQMRELHNPSVVKIDCEGAEFGAVFRDNLRGLEYLIMEIHGDKGRAETMLETVMSSDIQDYRVAVIQSGLDLDGVYIKGTTRVFGLKENLN